MLECTFCGVEMSRGTGLMYVKRDGKIFYFCSKKCEKNLLKLGRKPRVTTWTKEYARIKAAKKVTEDKISAEKKVEKVAKKESKTKTEQKKGEKK